MQDKHAEVFWKTDIKSDESFMEACYLLSKSTKTVICFVNENFHS